MLAVSCSIASDQGTHLHPGIIGETWKNVASFQANDQLAFLHKVRPLAPGIVSPVVDWAFLNQLATKTTLTNMPVGQFDLGNPSTEETPSSVTLYRVQLTVRVK